MSALTANDIRREGHGPVCSNPHCSLNTFCWTQEIVKQKKGKGSSNKIVCRVFNSNRVLSLWKKKAELASQPPAKLRPAFLHLIHSLLLHFRDVKPRWETRRVETAECKGSEDIRCPDPRRAPKYITIGHFV